MLWNTACLIFILLHIIFSSFSMAVTNQKLAKSINGAYKSWQTKQIIVILEYSQLAYQSNFKWRRTIRKCLYHRNESTFHIFTSLHHIFISLKKFRPWIFPSNNREDIQTTLKFLRDVCFFSVIFWSERILTFSIERSQKIQLGLT